MKAIAARFLAGLACGVFSSAALGETPSFKVLKLQGNPVQWRGKVAKQGTVVTYAVVAEDMAFEGARNCRKVSAENARTEISTAFGMWEAVANISFREEENVARADIVIGAQLDPVGWAFAEVFYDPSSRGPVKPISRSLICLNPERAWKVGFDGDLQRYDIRYTLAHEIGHAIGLDHPAGAGQIMDYSYREEFRKLQPGDIAGVLQLYGERRPDKTLASTEPMQRQQEPESTERGPATGILGKAGRAR